MSTGLIGEPWRHTLVDQSAHTQKHTHTKTHTHTKRERERECVCVSRKREQKVACVKPLMTVTL